MLKFLPGIILLQILTVAMVMLFNTSLDEMDWLGWLRLGVPLFVVAILTSFWFNAAEGHKHKEEMMRLREKHAAEREKIRVNAERAKTRAVQKTHKEMHKEINRTSAKASFKVGAAVVGVMSAGAFLLLTQFMTLGVMMLTAAGGTAGGYVMRMRQEKRRLQREEAILLSQQSPPKILPKQP